MLLLSASVILGATTSCKGVDPNAPKGEVCLVDTNKCRCYNTETNLLYDLTLEQCSSYIARSGDYDEKLNLWCKEGWRKYEEAKRGNK